VRRWTITGLGFRFDHGPFRCEGSELAESERVEVVALSEVRNSLKSKEALKAAAEAAELVYDDFTADHYRPIVEQGIAAALDAAFPSTDSEGQG